MTHSTIKLHKYGNLLISRPAGREAYLATKAYLLKSSLNQVSFDFDQIKVLTPSWIDEFITLLKKDYPNIKINFLPSNNPTVTSSLKVISV